MATSEGEEARKKERKKAGAPKAKARGQGRRAGRDSLPVLQGAAALDFYKTGFGARERMRMTGPDGSIGHAEILVSGAPIFVSDEYADMGVFAPTTVGGSPVTIHLYVRDVDALVAKATAAGATLLGAVADKPYGDRTGTIRDPFGHRWMVATKKESVGKAALRIFGESYKTADGFRPQVAR
jgi:PhnB protein